MRTLTAIGAALAVVGIATAASAADMPVRNYTKAPAYAPPALYNWTGFYAGVNAGGAWSRAGTNFGDASGFVGGGQIGYNWQAMGSPLVLGLEADFQGTSLKNTASAAGITGEAKVPAFGTVRGRIGYAGWDRWLPYFTGGLAYGNIKATPAFGGDWSKSKVGWTVGGGVEYALLANWTTKVEYLYADLGSVSGGTPGNDVTFKSHLVRAGLNYRF